MRPVCIVLILCSLISSGISQVLFEDNRCPTTDGQHGGNHDVAQDYFNSCKQENTTCVGYPENCHKHIKNDCDYMVSIKKKDGHYKFSLFGPPIKASNPSERRYVAVGLSKDGSKMKDVSIVECKDMPNENKFTVSWSGEYGIPSKMNTDDNGKPYVDYECFGIFKDRITCEFSREAYFMVNGHEFDLNKNPYHILMAHGKINDATGEIKKHEQKDHRYRSENPISLYGSKNTGPQNVLSSMFLSGICIVIAFII